MARVLIVNLYFSPLSFGGATIVAEQTAKLLQSEHGWEVLVVTIFRDLTLPPYMLKRYKSNGVNVVAINLPSFPDGVDSYANMEVANCILEIAESFRPDVCHCHAIQHIGCAFIDRLRERGSKIAVTLHDCWWLCERQFMINSDGLYCNQWKIDQSQCRFCVPDAGNMVRRTNYLREVLQSVDLLLYPSEFHRALHLANGFPSNKSQVNENGVTLPGESFAQLQRAQRRSRKVTAFGFVGGPGDIKGADDIVRAFREIKRTDYELKVVDAAGNLGATWNNRGYWQIPGGLSVLPPYKQETMDAFFAGIDVLLFPSRWKESFGLTVREALARDVWVIATAGGGVADALTDGTNADVIPFSASYTVLRDKIERRIDSERWNQYKNPLADTVRGYPSQAEELSRQLHGLL